MIRYIGVRLGQTVPVLIVVALFVFLIVHLTPGDPAAILLGPDATAVEINSLRDEMGLNRPLVAQFSEWFGGLLIGDLGQSVFLQQSVSSAIGSHIFPTLALSLLAEALAIAVAVPAGIAAARRPGSLVDKWLMGSTLLGVSIPSFLLGLLLALLFAVNLRWLPVAGYRNPSDGIGQFFSYLILPAIALAAMQAALIARMTRSTMLDVLSANFVTTAKAKGLSRNLVVYKHALRNAANPILTVVGQSFGVLLTGAVVIEAVFSIPGIGQLVVSAIQRRDLQLIQGVVLVSALLYVFLNLVVDMLYGVIDPRVRTKR